MPLFGGKTEAHNEALARVGMPTTYAEVAALPLPDLGTMLLQALCANGDKDFNRSDIVIEVDAYLPKDEQTIRNLVEEALQHLEHKGLICQHSFFDSRNYYYEVFFVTRAGREMLG